MDFSAFLETDGQWRRIKLRHNGRREGTQVTESVVILQRLEGKFQFPSFRFFQFARLISAPLISLDGIRDETITATRDVKQREHGEGEKEIRRLSKFICRRNLGASRRARVPAIFRAYARVYSARGILTGALSAGFSALVSQLWVEYPCPCPSCPAHIPRVYGESAPHMYRPESDSVDRVMYEAIRVHRIARVKADV